MAAFRSYPPHHTSSYQSCPCVVLLNTQINTSYLTFWHIPNKLTGSSSTLQFQARLTTSISCIAAFRLTSHYYPGLNPSTTITLNMGSIAENFDYRSLKELLKDTKADVLLPGDGQKYEDIIQRWSESCVKRAVRSKSRFSEFEPTTPPASPLLSTSMFEYLKLTCPVCSCSSPIHLRRLSNP